MNFTAWKSTLVVTGVLAFAVGAGCNRQTRGNADAVQQNKAASPAEGGATSTAGSAGRPENFGDIEAKKRTDEASPSGRSITGGASTGPDYSLEASRTDTGQPTQSKSKPKESPQTPNTAPAPTR